MCWLPAYVQRSVQPLTADVPVFVTFTSAWRLPGHVFVMVYVTEHAPGGGGVVGGGLVGGGLDVPPVVGGGVVGPPPNGSRYGVRYCCLFWSTVIQSSFRMPPVSPEFGLSVQYVKLMPPTP